MKYRHWGVLCVAIVFAAPSFVLALTATASPSIGISDSSNSASTNWTSGWASHSLSQAVSSIDGNVAVTGSALHGDTGSQYLKMTGFGFSIPANATITGITLSLTRRESSNSSNDLKDGAISLVAPSATTTSKASSAWWPTSLGSASYGASNDTWGHTWTASEINSALFGTIVSVHNFDNSSHSASIDGATITVAYTVPTATTLSVAATSTTYGSTTAVTATLSPAVAGKTINFSINGTPKGSATTNASGVATLSGISLTGINAGTYATGISGSFAGDSNYAASSGTGSLTVNKRPLTVTAVHTEKGYDGATTSTSTPVITSGILAYSDTATWSESFDTAAAGTGKTMTPAGTVTDGNSGNNYLVSFVTNTTGIINQAPLTATADAKAKNYGDADPVLTYAATGLKGSDATTTVLTGSLSRAPGEDVGSYSITQGTLALAGNNYTLTFVGANLVISSSTVNVVASSTDKIYGQTDPAFTYTTTPTPLEGNVFSGNLTRDAGEDAGVYNILQGTLGITNYNINFTSGLFTIHPADQTITFDPITGKTYGDADFQLAATSTSGIAPTYSTESSACSVSSSGLVHLLSAGSCTIVAGEAASTNYTVAQNVSQEFTIAQAPLYVTGITANDKVYDGTTTATISTSTASLLGILPSDFESIAADFSLATGSFDTADIGSGKIVNIGGITLTGSKVSSYTLVGATTTASITAQQTSTPAPSTGGGGGGSNGPISGSFGVVNSGGSSGATGGTTGSTGGGETGSGNPTGTQTGTTGGTNPTGAGAGENGTGGAATGGGTPQGQGGANGGNNNGNGGAGNGPLAGTGAGTAALLATAGQSLGSTSSSTQVAAALFGASWLTWKNGVLTLLGLLFLWILFFLWKRNKNDRTV